MSRWIKAGLVLTVLFSVVALTGQAVSSAMEPAVIGPPVAPAPGDYAEPIVQIYGADVWGFRGRFAIHTWIATKGYNDTQYTIYQVVGWQLRRRGTAVSIEETLKPNRYWFRSPPKLLYEARGRQVAEWVGKVEHAVAAYPFADEYVMWPGPNSNSFTQWVIGQIDELEFELPAKAIGKSWMLDHLAQAATVDY